MARNSQKEQNLENQEQPPMPSQARPNDQVSLVDPASRVPQPAPYDDIVIDHVESRPQSEPDPEPVVITGDDGSITIK